MKIKIQRATRWLLRGLFAFQSLTFSGFTHAASGLSARSNCEKLLLAAIAAPSNIELLSMFDRLDRDLWSLHDVAPEEMTRIRRRFESALDQALEDHIDEAQAEAKEILRDLAAKNENRFDPAKTDTDETPSSVSELEADHRYPTRHFYLTSVRFTPHAIKAMANLDPTISERLLRSIQKGLVPPRSGSGIVRCTDVHKNFVEVKIIGKSVARLIGCLRDGELQIKMVYHKRNEGAGGSLQVYSSLCDD